MILTLLQKLLKNVGNWGELIVAKGFEKLRKSNKLPNLVTLMEMYLDSYQTKLFIVLYELSLFPIYQTQLPATCPD